MLFVNAVKFYLFIFI